jgi:hypothetical protein
VLRLLLLERREAALSEPTVDEGAREYKLAFSALHGVGHRYPEALVVCIQAGFIM